MQLSSIAPPVSIPSTPLPPLFHPSASDVRVNVFWFVALAFSLLAAFLALLVQQWVRDYMYASERYRDPLKSARLRQYMYEGFETWHMLRVAEAVPGFLHLSLFLFFVGLADSLLNINTKVAISTIFPIGISSLLYIFSTFAPIIFPQSPYKNTVSHVFWYLFQKYRRSRFKDRDGEFKSVSRNMAERQMQLVMEETEARKERDVRAIRWLVDNMTEDAEMERFLLAIPGSFNTDWGTEVWRTVGECHENEDQSQGQDTTTHRPSSSWNTRSILRPIIHLVRKLSPCHPPTNAWTRSSVPHPPNVHPHSTTAHIRGENSVHELSTRVAHSVKICNNRQLFSNDDLWQKSSRACIEVTASLVFCANADVAWFGGILKLLRDIGCFEKIRELSLTRKDELFVARWTCLSLVAIQTILQDDRDVQFKARLAMESFESEDDIGNNGALEGAQKIDETLHKASDCLFRLYNTLLQTEDLTEVIEVLRGHESLISELEQINIEADRLELADRSIFDTQNAINHYSLQIASQIPGILDHLNRAPIPFRRFVKQSHDPRELQFIQPMQTLKSMCSLTTTLRNILEGHGSADAYKELLNDLEDFDATSCWKGDEMQRLFWRLQDLRDGGGLGFTVELFFLALPRLSSTSSNAPHSALYTGTFQAITSDWSNYKDSLGTQKLLLHIAVSRCFEFSVEYPTYIVNEFLSLLGNIFEGQTGPHVDKARQQFESFRSDGFRGFRERVLRVLTRE